MRQENGNALFMVLVGIILFAALSITALEGSQNSADLKNEEVKLAATELIDYSRNLQAGYKRLRTINNCLPENIEMTHDDWVGVTEGINPNAPADNSCELFSEAGGKVIYRPYGGQYFFGDVEFIGHGVMCDDAPCSELYHLIRLAHPSQPVDFSMNDAERICREINYQLFDHDNMTDIGDLTRTPWNGTFLHSTSMTETDYAGQRVFCTYETTNIVSLITILEAR